MSLEIIDIGMASQTGYDAAAGSSDGGSPTASTSFQTSVFSWTSTSSRLSVSPVNSSGRITAYGWMESSATYFLFAQTALNDYPTQVYFTISPV